MAKTIPMVRDGILLDDQTAGPTIYLDTPAWFAWLEAPATGAPRARFSYAIFNWSQGYIDGFLTVRKERRQRGGAYWLVYRRQGRRLRKVYVGRSAALTRDKLDQVAAALCQPGVPPP